MRDSDSGFVPGLIIGAAIGMILFIVIMQIDKAHCAKEHNVYRCEIKFVPVEESK